MKDLMIRESYKSKDGQDKVSWNKVGVLIETNGKQYVKLFHIPGQLISVFEQKPREEKPIETNPVSTERAWDDN